MQPKNYQSATPTERKEVVQNMAQGLREIDESKFPKITMSVKSGNNKKNQVLELIIEQMYSNNFHLENSFLSVEENI